MSAEFPPILIASDRLQDADMLATLLGEEFSKVHVSTDLKRRVDDFNLFKPGVLVLAFDMLEKAERYLRTLRQPSVMAHARPHRVLLLCTNADLREAYELCKKGQLDDFVLFWPKTDETRPLRMAVRRALHQVTALGEGTPQAADFAARARRLAALEPLLENWVAKANGDAGAADALRSLSDEVRALRVLADRWRPLVLVVDDDKFQHKLLDQVLGVAKVELSFVTSATEAIAGLHKRRPDLILMDVNLPDVDGVKATTLLKSAAQFAAIPVIMITGVGGKEMVVESLKAGAADFVVKPFDKDILLGKVRKALYGRTTA